MQRKLRVVLIDDEPLERGRLRRQLDAEPMVEVVGEMAGDFAAVEAIWRLAPDVIFLEVQLHSWTGFELVSAVGPPALSRVVFVTWEPEHAVQAFEIGALDYLLKPVDADRLETALTRARARAGLHLDEQAKSLVSRLERLVGRTDARSPGDRYVERFPVKEGGRVYFVRAGTIDWIESADNYVRLHTGGTTHLVRRTLAQVETELDPAHFVRIHRSTIVNLDRVREIQPGIGRYRLVLLESGAQLRLSERYHRRLEQLRGVVHRGPRLDRGPQGAGA